jgi:hypothetical protein
MTIHDIIYSLYPNIKKITEPDLVAYDSEDNEVEYDLNAVQAKAAELEAAEQAKAQAAAAARQSALNKLMALGLTKEEALALGVK